MPCYEPPPTWSNDKERSEREAVPLLCDIMRTLVRTGLPVDKRQLTWYIQHLELDIKMATHDQMGYNRLHPSQIDQARVAELTDLLSMARHHLASMP